MNEPSMVSISDMPAANRTGRQSTAYQGSPAPAAPPARTSSATSVAVSKPSPNSTPIGYICPGLVTVCVSRPRTPVEQAALGQLLLQLGLVVAAARASGGTRG